MTTITPQGDANLHSSTVPSNRKRKCSYAKVDRTITESGLHALAYRLYVFLATRQGQQGYATFGQQYVATHLGWKRETVGKYAKVLKGCGLISIEGQGTTKATYRVIHNPPLGIENPSVNLPPVPSRYCRKGYRGPNATAQEMSVVEHMAHSPNRFVARDTDKMAVRSVDHMAVRDVDNIGPSCEPRLSSTSSAKGPSSKGGSSVPRPVRAGPSVESVSAELDAPDEDGERISAGLGSDWDEWGDLGVISGAESACAKCGGKWPIGDYGSCTCPF